MSRGIYNLGNTCFLNTCLQILLHSYELHTLPLEICNTTIVEAKFVEQWILLLKEMIPENENEQIKEPFSPNAMIAWVQHIAKLQNRMLFTGNSQNDMTEFLLFFMDCFHTCFQRSIDTQIRGQIENETDNMAVECYKMIADTYKKEYSEIRELFYGISVSKLIDVKDTSRVLHLKPESFFILDLPIDGPNIYTCLQKYTTPELLEKENAWFNEKTGLKQDVYKQIVFWNFPPILVISLNRFYIDIEHNCLLKNMHLVDFPIDTLDLSSFVQGYHSSTFQYELYGVCNHIGDIMGGHYSAFVKTYKNEWFHCNDHIIEKVENIQHIITPMAYCLFYRKKNNSL